MSRRVGWAAVGVLVVLLVACGGGAPIPNKQGAMPRAGQPGDAAPAPTDWSEVGQSAKVGDVEFKALWAADLDINGYRFGQFERMGRMLMVHLQFTNTSATRRINFGGWQHVARITDEHGNKYPLTRFGSGFNFGDESTMTAGSESFDPGKEYSRYLFAERPVDVATEARLSLPAAQLGGDGEIHLRVPIKKRSQ